MCLLTTETRVRFPDLFALFPQVAVHLEGAVPTTAVRGAVTGARRLARVYRDTVALVGDASGSVDAITGAGLSLAFQQAAPRRGLGQGGAGPLCQRPPRSGPPARRDGLPAAVDG